MDIGIHLPQGFCDLRKNAFCLSVWIVWANDLIVFYSNSAGYFNRFSYTDHATVPNNLFPRRT